MLLQAQTILILSCSSATNSALRHSLGHPWSLSADSATNSPHKSHFNPLKWGLNSQYWAWQWPLVFPKPVCSCHLATLKLLSILPFWSLHFYHSRWTDQLASWRVKVEVSKISQWFSPMLINPHPSGLHSEPTSSQSSTSTAPQVYLMLWSRVLITSRSPSPATGAFKDAAKAGHGPSPPPKGPAVQICFHWSCSHSPADAARTHRHTPQALG